MKLSKKPFGCNFCEESFTLAKSVQEHVETHLQNNTGNLLKNLVVEKEIIAKKSAPPPIKGKYFELILDEFSSIRI